MLAAKLREGTLDEVGAAVGDDAVREAVTIDELTDELGSGLPVALGDWLGLNPLCEFVNRNEQVGMSSWSSLELAYQFESPDREWPGVMRIILSAELGTYV
jgi:hypothetical protein